ncbi:HAD family hydrolase [Prolixibacteraceae bacterium JC049]|nr:HAD family hydrolase [Prolixibacteraceae bacterium JC049]
MLQAFDNIIWDWNGTLLNDQEITMQCINRVLKSRGLDQLNTNSYREAFDFPIKDYYARIGFDFDKDPFSILAEEFISDYYSVIDQAQLHVGVNQLLDQLRTNSKNLFVLSAMEHQSLLKTLKQHDILHFFSDVSGLNDHHAASKSENGIKLLNHHQLDPKKTVLIGDTTHDADTAKLIGCQCILFSQGHQSFQKLQATQFPIIDELHKLFIN